MRKMIRRIFLCLVAVCCFQLGAMASRQDGVPDYSGLRQSVQQNLSAAESYFRENGEEIHRAAQAALEELGLTDRAAVLSSWRAYCSQTAERFSDFWQSITLMK